MTRRSRNRLFVLGMFVMSALGLLIVALPMLQLALDACMALLRSWGVLPGIGDVVNNTFRVLFLVLAVTLPLSLVITLWMYERVEGKNLKRIRAFLHGMTRMPQVLLGLVCHAVIGHEFAAEQSIYTMSLVLTVLALPYLISRMDSALRAVPRQYIEAGEALGGKRREILLSIVVKQALPDIVRAALELVERVLCETTALLVLMGAVMPDQVLATELFRLTYLGRKDAAVLAMLLLGLVLALRTLTMRRWRREGGKDNCRYNWW